MEIRQEGQLLLEPVPRDYAAPWLSARSNKWALAEEWCVIVDGRRWKVPAGYVTDLSSIPRLAWTLFPPSYSPARRAAVLHDWFYSHGFRAATKAYADRVFRQMMIQEGAPRVVAWLFWAAVRANVRGGAWRGWRGSRGF